MCISYANVGYIDLCVHKIKKLHSTISSTWHSIKPEVEVLFLFIFVYKLTEVVENGECKVM